MEPHAPLLASSDLPWTEPSPLDSAPRRRSTAPAARPRLDPFSPLLDRVVIAATILCAVVVALGSNGAHPSNSREIEPLTMTETAVR